MRLFFGIQSALSFLSEFMVRPIVITDKRRRNTRPSKYRPRTEAQKLRRQALWDARADDRLQRGRLSEQDALRIRLD